MNMRYDLHCHSIYSDGSKTVPELLLLAKEEELSGLSITDHDTIKAYSEAIELAKAHELKLLPGVEISAALKGKSVHILAYSFSTKDSQIIKFIEKSQKIRAERNLEMLERLNKEGLSLTLEELKDDIGVVGRPHFASALLNKGYVENIREAFDRYIGDDEKCFVPGNRPEVQEVLDAIHQAKGFAVIAHPHLIRNNRLVKELLNLPFDGLEAYYAKFTHREEKKWIQLADNREWLKTGGSDFHGDMKPFISLGCSWVGEETFQLLYQRYLENDRLFNA